MPQTTKTGIITHIHKNGSRGDPTNYRPVTLTSLVIELSEKVVRKKLVNFISEKGQVNEGQHRFRTRCSCMSQLLAHQDHILEELEEGSNVYAVHLDFARHLIKWTTVYYYTNSSNWGSVENLVFSFMTS